MSIPLGIIITMQCFIFFWIYHVLHGEKATDPALAAAYPPIPRAIASSLDIKQSGVGYLILDWFEKASDLVGLFVCAAGIWFTKEYVLLVREGRREAGERKALGTKGE
jgi:hypothetical protein